jgi:hypothetical protein
MLKGNDMKVIYTSPVFKHADGSPRQFLVPLAGLSTHARRDECLIKMIALGGIHAVPTPEFLAIRKKMLAAKKKIEKNGWFAESR